MGDTPLDPTSGRVAGGTPPLSREPLLLAQADASVSAGQGQASGSFQQGMPPRLPLSSGSSSPNGPAQIGQLGQVIQPNPPPPAALPITVDSPHCVGSTVTDLQQLFQQIQTNPQRFAQGLQDRLLPQLLDQGNIEINFGARMNPGTYRGGLRVEGPTMVYAHLTIQNGRLSGELRFEPHLVKSFGPIDVNLNSLRLETDEHNQIHAIANATFFEFDAPASLGTEDVAEMLLGERLSSIPGPASHLIAQIMAHAQVQRPENLVDLSTARFSLRVNPRPNDPAPLNLGQGSSVSANVDRLQITDHLALSNIHAGLEIRWNPETRGFRVTIPEATIGNIHEAPGTQCGTTPNAGADINNVSLRNVTLDLAPQGNPAELGDTLYNHPEGAFYLRGASGEIQTGQISVNQDIVVSANEGANAIRFNITGQPNGDMTADVTVPRLNLNRAAVTLGGEMLHNLTAGINVGDAALANGQFHVELHSGQLSYNGSITPGVTSASVEQHDASGNLLAGASAMGLQCEPITFRREQGSDVTRIHVPDCDLRSATVNLHGGLPITGTVGASFNNLGADISVSPTGVSIDRFQFPDFIFNSDTTAEGIHTVARVVDGPAGAQPSGLALQRDSATGPTSTATINTRVQRVRFTVPNGPFAGTYEMTGQLTGTGQIVDIAAPVPGQFTPPSFRPTVGHLALRLNGTIRQISGGNLRLSGSHITLSDNGRGMVSISGRTDASGVPTIGEVDNAHVTIRANFSGNIHRLERPGQSPISYYDLNASGDNAIGLPQILLGATIPGVGTLGLNGNGRIWSLPNDPHFSATFPLGRQQLDINNDAHHIAAHIDLNGGSLTARGDLRNITLNVQPPRDVQVHFTQVLNSVTYTYDGTLHSQSSLQANVDVRRRRVSFRETGATPQLTGDLTVTATRAGDGGATQTLGAGSVHITTNYQVSGDIGATSGHITLRVPETGLTGQVTSAITAGSLTLPAGTQINLPIRGFEGRINLNPQAQTFTSTWTLADVSQATVSIPRLSLPGGIDLQNVTADFSAMANGQQWEVARTAGGQITFRALPGADGNLPPFRVQLAARDGDHRGLELTLGSSSSASGIGGRVDPATGDILLDVTGMRLNSTTNGHVSINGQAVELSNIVTNAGLPMLQVRINQQTGAMSLTVRPDQPTGVTYPPTDLTAWAGWTTDQWRAYQQQMNGTGHLAVLSEGITAGIVGNFLPRGRGNVYLDLPNLDLTANLNDPASIDRMVSQLQSALVMRREFPNPPPRAGEGDPILLSDAQRPLYRTTEPAGTLFFIRHTAANGQVVDDPDLARNLGDALGLPQNQIDPIIKSGRLEMDDLVRYIRTDPAIAAAIDAPTLTNLVSSYLQDSQGSFQRFSQRMLITLGNIRRSLPRSDSSPGILGTDAEGRSPIAAHQFGDPSYHVGSAPNDGTDMQFLSVLPMTPAQAQAVLTGNSSGAWDPWVASASLSGSTETGSLLDHNYRIVRSASQDGNIPVVRLITNGASGMAASSRTIRLLPLSGGRTLMVMDQHEDFSGAEADIRWPRMSMPHRPDFNIATVGPGLLGVINPRAPEIGRFYANRFALMSQHLIELQTGNHIDGVRYITPTSISHTDLNVDFLALNTTDAANPVLRISPDAAPSTVRRQLTGRLHVTDAVAANWVSQGRIPLNELMRETHLDQTFTLPVFQSVAQVMLADPQPEPTTMQNFTARTERFLIMVEDLMSNAEIRQDRGGSYNARIREMRDPRFHQRSTEQVNDVVDTYMYWYVPTATGATPDNITWFVHHADQFPNYDSANFIPSSVISGPDPTRTYVSTGVHVDLNPDFHYQISTPRDPVTLSGGVLFSPWRQEDRGSGRDFLDNQGWWLTLPLSDNSGYIVIRAGVINTRLPADRDDVAARTAATRVVNFMPSVIRAARDHGHVTSGATPSYNMVGAIQVPDLN